MAGCLGIGIVGAFLAPNAKVNLAPKSLTAAVVEPVRDFFHRLGTRQAILVSIFIVVFRLGDAMVAKMAIAGWALAIQISGISTKGSA